MFEKWYALAPFIEGAIFIVILVIKYEKILFNVN